MAIKPKITNTSEITTKVTTHQDQRRNEDKTPDPDRNERTPDGGMEKGRYRGPVDGIRSDELLNIWSGPFGQRLLWGEEGLWVAVENRKSIIPILVYTLHFVHHIRHWIQRETRRRRRRIIGALRHHKPLPLSLSRSPSIYSERVMVFTLACVRLSIILGKIGNRYFDLRCNGKSEYNVRVFFFLWCLSFEFPCTLFKVNVKEKQRT